MPLPVSAISIHTSFSFAMPLRMVIVPRSSIECPALTNKFRNTWFNCEGRHSISGNSP